MNTEENIKQDLIAKFGYLQDEVRVQRARRIFIEVTQEKFFEVFDFVVKNLKFSHLCTISGLDEGPNLTFIYHVANKSGTLINIKTFVLKEKPILKTITPYFPGAEIYERELMDLLGVKIDTLTPGIRYPLPDDFPTDEFPLRKDWKPKSENRGQKTEDR
jgi:Ni,Fe-hydrogenase III component G